MVMTSQLYEIADRMNLPRLYEIIRDCSAPFRKGDVVYQTAGGATVIDAVPPAGEARADLEIIDCHFIKVGVDRAAAERSRDELVELLKPYERLASGQSYIEVGAVIGDQGAAFQLFAIGEVLRFWKVLTPEFMGLTGADAESAAGLGLIMVSGFNPSGSR